MERCTKTILPAGLVKRFEILLLSPRTNVRGFFFYFGHPRLRQRNLRDSRAPAKPPDD